MDWVNFFSMVFGAVGTGYGILTGTRQRQLSRHAIKLDIGVLNEREVLPKKFRKMEKNTLMFGIKGLIGKHAVLSCPYRIGNPTDLPLGDVTLELQYQASQLIDNAVIVDDKEGTATLVKGLKFEKREVIPAGDLVLVRYHFPSLRPGETIAFPDLIKLTRVNEAHPEQGSASDLGRLHQRLTGITEYFGASKIKATLWSSNVKPIAKHVNVLCFAINDEKEFEPLFKRFADAIWDGKKLQPGIYFKFRPSFRRKPNPFTDELCEMIVPPDGKLPLDQETVSKNVFNASRSIAQFRMPPWGLYDQSFDLKEYVGKRVIKYDN